MDRTTQPSNETQIKKKKTFTANIRKKEYIPIFLMIGIPFVFFVLFSIYPLIWSLRYAFYNYDGYNVPKFIGLDNFMAIIADKYWWRAVGNSFAFSLKLLIELPLAFITAVILNYKIKGWSFFRLLYFVPNLIGAAIITLVFKLMLNPYNGIINASLMKLGIIHAPVDWLSKPFTVMLWVILISVWQWFGYNMVMFLAGLQTVPKELYESSIIDGANKGQQMLYITLPMIGPVFRMIAMLGIIGSLQVFDYIQNLTNGNPARMTETMYTYLFKFFFVGQGGTSQYPQLGMASAANVISAVIIIIISVVFLKGTRKMDMHS